MEAQQETPHFESKQSTDELNEQESQSYPSDTIEVSVCNASAQENDLSESETSGTIQSPGVIYWEKSVL